MNGEDVRAVTCVRCGGTVYPVDCVGPLREGACFHRGCFKCLACGTRLSLRTYLPNQQSAGDREAYCASHAPRSGPAHIDNYAVGIQAALSAPRLSSGSRAVAGSRATLDAASLEIAHGLNATRVRQRDRRRISDFLDPEVQRRLEMRHRAEEDALYRQFATKRQEEENLIREQIQEEWEIEMEKLQARFQQEVRVEKGVAALRREQDALERAMTIRLDKRKDALSRKLLEAERAATADMVERHSREMLNLINEKKSEYNKVPNGVLPSSSQQNGTPSTEKSPPAREDFFYPAHPPPPGPPSLSKKDIYTDPAVFSELDQLAISVAQEDHNTFTDLVRMLTDGCLTDVEKARTIFRWITVKNLNTMEFNDDVTADTPMGILRGIKHGTESYHVLFKRLCSYAGLHCVVIKGYSKSAGYQPGLGFDDHRFRNSWNAVYVAEGWRFVQCNWGARHLVNAPRGTPRGPEGLRYEYDDHYFLTDPRDFVYEFFPLHSEWQLLKTPVSLKDFEELPFVRSLFFRYGLYFPDPNTKAILNTNVNGAATVRIGMPPDLASNLIFHYNLKFYDSECDMYEGIGLKRFVMQSVTSRDPTIVTFRVHAPCCGSLLLDVFANAVTPREYLTGEPIKFKSVAKFKIACLDLHTAMVPLPDCASGEWGPAKAQRLFGLEPLDHKEPLIVLSDRKDLELSLRMTRPLTDFMATLHRNGMDEKRLAKKVTHTISNDIVTFRVTFPEEGQYGMDIYTRDLSFEEGEKEQNGRHLLTHCCKYLINVSLNG